jgi:hypothetical protein
MRFFISGGGLVFVATSFITRKISDNKEQYDETDAESDL